MADQRAEFDQIEDDLWDALNDTTAARCCDCPSCNYYLPEGEYRPESKCVHRAGVEALMAHERERVLREFEGLADFWALSKGWVGAVALGDFRQKIAVLRATTPPAQAVTHD